MKSVKSVLFIVFALIISMQFAVYSADEEQQKISVTINDNPIVFWQQDPVIIDGYTLVPVREISETLGAKVNWNQTEKKVSLIKGDVGAAMRKDEKMITIYSLNGETILSSRNVTLDTSVVIINGKTMVPVRVVAETFGVNVQWHARSRTVRLYTPDYSVGQPIILGE